MREQFHYTIRVDGTVDSHLSEDEKGQHPKSIGIKVEGDFDEQSPYDSQIASLKKFLLELKLRYPQIAIGAHRQVRGDSKTTCPGRRFPMNALREWAKSELIEQRDEFIRTTVESQYGP